MRKLHRSVFDIRGSLVAAFAFCSAMSALAQNSPDAIGRAMKFQDTTTFAQIYVYRPPATCPSGLTNVRCIALASPTPGIQEQVNADDLIYVDVAPFAAHSLLIFTMNPYTNVLFRNVGATNSLSTSISVGVRITIESDVLNNPALRNPMTGMPFNGKLTSVYTFFQETESLALPPNQYRSSSARRAFETQILSRSMLMGLGLNATQAADVFARPIRVRIGYVVNSLNLSTLSAVASGRLMSD